MIPTAFLRLLLLPLFILAFNSSVSAAALEGEFTYLATRTSPKDGTQEYEIRIYVKGDKIRGDISKSEAKSRSVHGMVLMDYAKKVFYVIDIRTSNVLYLPIVEDVVRKKDYIFFDFPNPGKKTLVQKVEFMAFEGTAKNETGEVIGNLIAHYLTTHEGPKTFQAANNISKLSLELNFFNLLFSANEKKLLYHTGITLKNGESIKISLIRSNLKKLNEDVVTFEKIAAKKPGPAPSKK